MADNTATAETTTEEVGKVEGADKTEAQTTTETAETAETTGQNDATKTAIEVGATTEEADDADKDDQPGKWPDGWHELMAGEDPDLAKLAKRYATPTNLLKALADAQKTIRSGKLKKDMPDPADEKAMADWRKMEGIPDDPTGYELPETVKKRMTDADKPILSSFTDYAHKHNAKPEAVALASEWYFDMMDQIGNDQEINDKSQAEKTEETLRADMGRDYRANTTMAFRFISEIPGVGADWIGARLPDGRKLGNVPEFVTWAVEQARERYGDVAFSSSEGERQHSSDKEAAELMMKTDINRYYSEGWDKKLEAALERESKRGRKAA